MVIALFLGAIVIAIVKENPIEIYRLMFVGAFGSETAIAGTLAKATTLIFVGLSYGFAYKCGLINLGIEGQIYMGGLLSSIIAIYMELPSALHILLCIIAGFLGGAIWGGLVAVLKNKFNASELITTVMMNYIAIYFVSWLVNTSMKEANGTYPQSEDIQQSAQLFTLVPKTQLTIGIIFAVIAVVLYWLYWSKSKKGFEMNVVGTSNKVARYAGINVEKSIFWSMFVSGGLGGLAGTIEVLGVQHKILEGLSAGLGYDGIAVSLLGGNSAIGIMISSVLFGALRFGGTTVQLMTGLPIAVVYIIQGLVILFVLVDILKQRRNA